MKKLPVRRIAYGVRRMLMVLAIMLATCGLPLATSFAATSIDGVEALVMSGDYAGAAAQADTAIRSRSGKMDELYYLKGLSELKLRKFAEARQSFGYVLSRYPSSKKAFDARLGTADAYMLEGSLNDAVGAYLGITRDHPKDRNLNVVYSRLAACYKGLGVTDKAEYYRRMSGGAAMPDVVAKADPVATKPAPQARRQAIIMPQAQRVAVTNISPKAPRPAVSDVSAEPENIDLVMATDKAVSVQVGSFRSRINADRLARKLASSGFDSRVEIPVRRHDNMFRVKVGRFSSKGEAQATAVRLKSAGYSTKICDGETCE